MKWNSILVLETLVISGLSTISYAATTTNTPTASTTQMETLMHDYIMQHPEVIVESLQKFQEKQIEQAVKKIQANAVKFSDPLFHQSTDTVIGNPNGNITLVEFFDYQCVHCMAMQPVLESLIKSNNDIRVVLKDFPIFGPMSLFAAKAGLAAQKQGKYVEFHNALMKSKQRPLTEDIVYNIAKTSGLDVNQLKTDMKNEALTQLIRDNVTLGKNLQITGTPAIFIKKTDTKDTTPSSVAFIPGEVGLEQLKDVIKKIGS